jgi:hypothetical protein
MRTAGHGDRFKRVRITDTNRAVSMWSEPEGVGMRKPTTPILPRAAIQSRRLGLWNDNGQPSPWQQIKLAAKAKSTLFRRADRRLLRRSTQNRGYWG